MSTILFILIMLIFFILLPELTFVLVILGIPLWLVINADSLQKRSQLTDFRCSEQQILLVQLETDYCIQVGGDGAKCFTQAKMSICDKILNTHKQ